MCQDVASALELLGKPVELLEQRGELLLVGMVAPEHFAWAAGRLLSGGQALLISPCSHSSTRALMIAFAAAIGAQRASHCSSSLGLGNPSRRSTESAQKAGDGREFATPAKIGLP